MKQRWYPQTRALLWPALTLGGLVLFLLWLQSATANLAGEATGTVALLPTVLALNSSHALQATVTPLVPRLLQPSPTPAPFLLGVEAAQQLTVTITPAAIFATATAAREAVLTAQANITVTPTAPLRPVEPVVGPQDATATALYLAADATVAAVLTSVDQPGLNFATFTPTATPIVVTATPTPGNLYLAATLAAAKTIAATTTGTATPVPDNWRVITPIVAFPTPTPANVATAEQLNMLATVYAATTGTPDPYREFIFVTVVTATPTATNMAAAAQTIVAATQEAVVRGTATPLPVNWLVVTPVVVTVTPTPATSATATMQALIGRAIAILTGTPLPEMIVEIATPTPALRPVEDLTLLVDDLPWRSPKDPFPAELVGKILFIAAFNNQERVYAINPDGSGLAELTDHWAYRIAEERDAYAADGSAYAYAYQDPNDYRIQLHVTDYLYQSDKQLTAFGTGIAWQPAWSPTSNRIAFVSNESRNDEIWVVERGVWPAIQYTHNEWEWDHHPSWSPDGNTIVFSSNRTGKRQLWYMDADGGNQRQLTNYEFEVWNPVWVKYANPYVVKPFDAENPEREDCLVCVK